MAGETSGPGPIEQEIRMVALERKFDELLSFVQLIARRNLDGENQRKEDDKDANDEEPEGHSNANTTPPPQTPPKPEGKDSQLDSKINSLEEKIRLVQGLNSFGNTDFSSMSWFPNMTVPPKFKAPEFEKYNERGDPMIHLQMYCRKMAPYVDNEPLLIQTFQDTLTGHAAEWYSQLKKISHWKELGGYLPGSIRFQLPNSSGLPPAKKALTKKKEGDVQMIGRSNGRPRQVLPTFTMQPIQPRPTPISAPTQVPAPAPTPQMPARPAGNQVNNNRLPRKEPRQFTPLPMPLTELYPILIEKNLISPIVLRPYNGPQRRDFDQNLTCDFHFGEVGHSVNKFQQLRHRVQDLIDHGILKGSGRLVGSSQWPSIVEAPISHLEGARTHHPIRSTTGAINRGYNIVEDEMDLNDLLDEEEPRGYYMEDDTDEWRSVDFSELLQFPYLIVPRGFETPEFEIFYENVTCEGSGKSQPSEHPT
uniref:Retrotransposon gag domain-containing protein n=1 Tax=Fagus sylvatica TaxID=28930 RepID=A0A2N9HJI6_FAGSY